MASSKPPAVAKIVTEFTLDVFKHAAQSTADENVFMSPSSILVVMAMLHAGARNNTLDQMSKTLKFGEHSKKEVLQMMQDFTAIMKKGSKSVTLQSANRLYPHTDKTIIQEYVTMVTKHFGADVRSMDYTFKPEESRKEINTWVEEETKQKIKNLLPDGSITDLTAMVVVNAIYFKGNWATQFDKAATKKMDFHAKVGKVKVDMMSKKIKKVKYGESSQLNCKVLELPYEGEELGMIIVLPNANNGLQKLETQLTVEDLSKLIADVYSPTVEVSIPKFKLESSFMMKEILSALGMTDVFIEEKSDLADMSNEELYVSEVFHKAFVDVNEEGTEAAAATGRVAKRGSMSAPPMKFVADHPFLFMIWDHRTNSPLFVGRFVKPAEGQDTQQREEL